MSNRNNKDNYHGPRMNIPDGNPGQETYDTSMYPQVLPFERIEKLFLARIIGLEIEVTQYMSDEKIKYQPVHNFDVTFR